MNKFVVGSKVTMNLDKIISKNGTTPPWYADKIFTIKNLTMQLDIDGFQIIEVAEDIPMSGDNKISTIYLDVDVKYTRKLKLSKLYGK